MPYLQKKESKTSHAVPIRLVQTQQPDRAYYVKHFVGLAHDFFSKRVTDLQRSLLLVFSLDSMEFKSFAKYIWPSVSSISALLLGDYFLNQMSELSFGNSEYAFIYKFIFGAVFLSYSALNRITDSQYTSPTARNLAVVLEIVAIQYMYSSVFNGACYLLQDVMSYEYALIMGLALSAILVPSLIAHFAKKVQNTLVEYEHHRGAQRADNAVISSGLTSISNLYFQTHLFLSEELLTSPRLFQLGLVAHNIDNADKLMQKFRNLPALWVDLTPTLIKKIKLQRGILAEDWQYNNHIHQVLRFDEAGNSYFIAIPRYQLRTGDLVHCNKTFDLNFAPISGEIVSLEQSSTGFTKTLQRQKFSINLKSKTGEDVWINHQSKPNISSDYQSIDLHAVRDGKQAGVLIGNRLNFYNQENFFIQVKQEKELLFNNDYEKKSVIDGIIAARKKKNVYYSILGALLFSPLIQRNLFSIPAETLRLMFTLFQTMIPFSETFLRETINSGLVKKMNSNLGNQSLEIIDALRIVDLCNALGGYYKESFSKGVAIISDKTGTLTTTQMNVLGLWNEEMAPTQYDTQEEDLLPPEAQWHQSFMVFCSAYTNSQKEQEPEEHAILEFFKQKLDNDCLQVQVSGNNHLQKKVTFASETQDLETYHLGLYRVFGGRFTLVRENSSYSLVFCGIPKKESFKETNLLSLYTKMQVRTGVLSRDWCLARVPLRREEFLTLHAYFEKDAKEDIEKFFLKNTDLLNQFQFHGTFLINNPLKKDAEHFIGRCREISVPVFVATGDTTEAAKNIAAVLCRGHIENIHIINTRKVDSPPLLTADFFSKSASTTVIFSGINDAALSIFQQIMNKEERPVVIFAEMSTEDKGKLARYLKDNHYFVVANGDGSNDIMMMKMAHMVIAHQSDDGTFAPGVEALSNLSEEQLKKLFHSKGSFYELFDIHLAQSAFLQYFAPLANSQEKPSFVLALKSVKMTFELAKAFGKDVSEMNQQHWYSVAFDLLWLWISSYEIDKSSDLPLDNQNINVSNLIPASMGIALAVAVLQAASNYLLFNESTNLTCMLSMLMLLPFILKSIFLGFKNVQDDLYPQISSEPISSQSITGSYQGRFFKPKVEEIEMKKEEPFIRPGRLLLTEN